MPETFEEVVKREIALMRKDLERLANDQADLHEDIHGVPARGIKGLRERIDLVQDLTTTMAREREAMNNKLKGLLIGLSLTGIGTAGTLAAVVRLLIGAP